MKKIVALGTALMFAVSTAAFAAEAPKTVKKEAPAKVETKKAPAKKVTHKPIHKVEKKAAVHKG